LEIKLLGNQAPITFQGTSLTCCYPCCVYTRST